MAFGLNRIPEPAAIRALERRTPGRSARVLTDRRVRAAGIHVGDLLPEIPGCPAHGVLHAVVLDHVAPAARAALRAEKLLKPFVAEYQHWISLDHELGGFVRHTPGLELFRLEQVQEVLLAIAFKPLLGVGRAKQLPFLGPAVAS